MVTPTVSSQDSIFYNPPSYIEINEKGKTLYSTSGKLNILIEELKNKGPLVAFGSLGPNFYNSAPFALKDKFGGKQIFGWKPGTRSSEKKTSATYAFVIGARRISGQEYIYFTMSKDITSDSNSFVRKHQITHNSRVYISSHKVFYDHLIDLYPQITDREAITLEQPIEVFENLQALMRSVAVLMNKASVEESTHSNSSNHHSLEKESAQTAYNITSHGFLEMSPAKDYLNQLKAIPLNAILGDREDECKLLGQKIFDTFKAANHGNSQAGQEAVIAICNATISKENGSLRKQYIERAWNGIGDDLCTWRA